MCQFRYVLIKSFHTDVLAPRVAGVFRGSCWSHTGKLEVAAAPILLNVPITARNTYPIYAVPQCELIVSITVCGYA